MSMPPVLFYVIVEHEDEVFHERAFSHEMSAKEWASGFDDEKFTVTMGRYALSPWPKRKRTANATPNEKGK